MAEKEKVNLNDGSECEIICKRLGGRRAFQLSSKILNINEFAGDKDNPIFRGEMNITQAPEICWDHIVTECPQRDDVCVKDMQRIYDKYAKDDIDTAMKPTLNPKS